ncbi:MAG: hypothetical protein QM500_03435 [Methylococcales bacterium]
MKIKNIKIYLFITYLFFTPLTYANACDYLYPQFIVNDVNQWANLSAKSVFDNTKKQTLAKAKKEHNQGIKLATLLKDQGKLGSLVIYTCGNKNLSFEISELLTSDPEKSDYHLVISNKHFFKLVTKQGSQPLLKKISKIKLMSVN